MTRYISDQNAVALLHESGTYGVTSGAANIGVWVGQVSDHSIDDNEGLIVDRYLGNLSRSYGTITPGPQDVTGNLTMYPQDMRLLFWAIGSVTDQTAVAANAAHYVNQVNTNQWLSPFTSGTNTISAPISFALEDSKTAPGTGVNFNRTVRGCVPNSVKLSLAQGEKAILECSYVAQSLTHGSGTALTLTGSNITRTPYLWSNSTLTLAGSPINTAKEISFEINNNLEAPHYINGSRVIGVPILGNREYNLEVKLDLDSDLAKMFYSGLYKTNTAFNANLDLNADSSSTGSAHTILFLSGCKIMAMDNPSVIDGTTESKISIMAQSVIGSSIDTVIKYNPY